MTFTEYLASQGLNEPEIKDVMNFYGLWFMDKDYQMTEKDLKLYLITNTMDAEKFYNNYLKELQQYNMFIVEKYLSKIPFDTFINDYIDYFSEKFNSNHICYCKSTKKIVYFNRF